MKNLVDPKQLQEVVNNDNELVMELSFKITQKLAKKTKENNGEGVNQFIIMQTIAEEVENIDLTGNQLLVLTIAVSAMGDR